MKRRLAWIVSLALLACVNGPSAFRAPKTVRPSTTVAKANPSTRDIVVITTTPSGSVESATPPPLSHQALAAQHLQAFLALQLRMPETMLSSSMFDDYVVDVYHPWLRSVYQLRSDVMAAHRLLLLEAPAQEELPIIKSIVRMVAHYRQQLSDLKSWVSKDSAWQWEWAVSQHLPTPNEVVSVGIPDEEWRMVQACRLLAKAQHDTAGDVECAAVEQMMLAAYERNPAAGKPPEEFDVGDYYNSPYFDTTSLRDLGVEVKVADPERPRAARDAEFCQYAGFAFGLSVRASLGPKRKPLVQIESAEIAQLTLPTASNPTGSLEMTWPLVNTLYFEHGTVLRSPQRIEFLREHLWLEANRPVETRQVSANRAELSLGLEPALGGLQLHTEVECRHLTLQSGPTSPKPDEADFRAILAGSGVFPVREAEVTLHAEPGGPTFLRWRAVERSHWYLRILEESDGWTRVRSVPRNGVVFEGWLPRQGIAAPRGEWAYTPTERRRRMVNRASRERTELLDTSGKPTGLVLAARVPVQAQRRNGPWLGVEIPGLVPLKEGTLFWIRETDLRAFY